MASVNPGLRASRRREPGARALAPAGRQLYYTNLPLTILLAAAVFVAFSKHLEGKGCQAAAMDTIGNGSLAELTVYVPEGFPCGRPTLHQAVWLLGHPSASFLLSADPTHRCWMFVAAVLTPFVWLLSCFLASAVSPSASADYGIQLRSAFFPLIRIVPKAMALAQLLAQGPIHTVIDVYTRRYQTLTLVHVLITSFGSHYFGLLNLPLFLAVCLAELQLSLTSRYLLSMHGHATWTFTHVTTTILTCLGVPLLLTACMWGWERRSRRQRMRLHGGNSDSGSSTEGGLGGTGLGTAAAAAAAAKIEDHVAGGTIPSPSSAAGSLGEASPAVHLKQQQVQLQGRNEQRGQPAEDIIPVGSSTECAGRRVSNSAAQRQQQLGQPSDGEVPVGNSLECARRRVSCSAAAAAKGQKAVKSASSMICAADRRVGEIGVPPASGGGRTAALTGTSLLAAASAAVAANNRTRGRKGGAVLFDEPEKWASVITARQILAQPMAEWQPMFTRQRVSIKVGPYSCSSAYRPS